MDNLKLLSIVYELGLGCGLFATEDIIKFSDKVIETFDNPSYAFLELSMMKDSKIDDIEGKLREFHCCNDKMAVDIVLSLINNKLVLGTFGVEKSIRTSTRLLIHQGLYWEKEYYDLYSMDDAFDMASDRIHFDLDDVIDTYKELLVAYEKYYMSFTNAYIELFKNDNFIGFDIRVKL